MCVCMFICRCATLLCVAELPPLPPSLPPSRLSSELSSSSDDTTTELSADDFGDFSLGRGPSEPTTTSQPTLSQKPSAIDWLRYGLSA
jgi:hypothetical protein